MKFIALKTSDGAIKGNISFYCKILDVTRQGFYQYLSNKDRPWKYQALADAMMQIHASKCITDVTEIKACDGKLYISALFDCFDSGVLGLSVDTNMKAPLCVKMLASAMLSYPKLKGAILHSDRSSQYTSQLYRKAVQDYGIQQSMNSAGGRCHDNARCESMWARMKSELLYGRYDTQKMTTEELKVLIWRYFMSYWNNRRICSRNGGLPPMVKRQQFYDSLDVAS
jgi:putative ISMca2, transposase, orfB